MLVLTFHIILSPTAITKSTMNTTNTTALSEELQGPPFGGSVTAAFSISSLLVLLNLVWTLWQLSDRSYYKSVDCQTHNSDDATKNNLEPTQQDFMSRNITSRNAQCLAVTFSSFLLLAQLVQGCWVLQIFVGVTVERFTGWTEVTSHFKTSVLRYMANLPAIVLLLFMWMGVLGIGAVVLHVQWRYTKELLVLKIRDQSRRQGVETGDGGNGSEIDLECGLFTVDKEASGNLFGTTYR